ncbi:hypothetical protein [Collinsella aerofaciens]|uniref:hypothetical protein n=1 Tax=Collinsella aerofaciens TaxID=74426 RepID=UPI001D002030|nr:hypothetical protein [Collinsella aerofaciens]MCB5368985.1 hypothetical protein [Collinsella aerofaciens]
MASKEVQPNNQEGKKKVIFKMTNFEYNTSIACTHKFIGAWQKEGFIMTGYKIVDPDVSVMDVKISDIPDNVL